ncbi:hypothetical protein pVco14_039 [Vibrio phage pVco-14]|nr:hypothetical protein pVco14_039 [Vibrio phage pVco-14]
MSNVEMFGLVILANGTVIDLDGGSLSVANLKAEWSLSNLVVAITDGSIPEDECEVYAVENDEDYTFTSTDIQLLNAWLAIRA